MTSGQFKMVSWLWAKRQMIKEDLFTCKIPPRNLLHAIDTCSGLGRYPEWVELSVCMINRMLEFDVLQIVFGEAKQMYISIFLLFSQCNKR